MDAMTNNNMSGLEKRLTYRSLLCLAKSLESLRVIIDLRNENSVTGILVYVDGYCNLSMEDATYIQDQVDFKYFSNLHIPCRMIRDIIIPDSVQIAVTINSFTFARPKQKTLTKQGRTFKQKRALLMQKESRKLIAEIQANK